MQVRKDVWRTGINVMALPSLRAVMAKPAVVTATHAQVTLTVPVALIEAGLPKEWCYLEANIE